MRHLSLLLAVTSLPLLLISPARANRTTNPSLGAAVVREMNLARQHPEVYADYLETQRTHYRGNLFVLPNGALLRTHEGVGGLDAALRFLRHAQPVGALAYSEGLSLAAADHVVDQAGGSFGHFGSHGSDPGARLNRHGTWSVRYGEDISYGKSSAREIVTALIIDDGLRDRKHRENIFNPAFNFAGAAVGPHARYHTVCSIDFAGGFAERGAASLYAGN